MSTLLKIFKVRAEKKEGFARMPNLQSIRKRKGLPPEPPNPAEFIDKGVVRPEGLESLPARV